jgi:hypothetical protein
MKHRISICLTDVQELIAKKHPSVNTAKNGKVYINLDLWINDKADQYGNDIAVKVYNKDTKESKFVGNGKQYKPEDAGNKPNKLPF